MPQLDLMTFMPQYFWLVVFFLFFYNLITNYMLPRLFTMMKVRKEKIASLQSDASADAVNDYDTIMRSTTSRARVAITEAAQSSIKQVAAKAAFINENAWADSNQKYLQALGNLQVKSYVISSLLAQGSGKKR